MIACYNNIDADTIAFADSINLGTSAEHVHELLSDHLEASEYPLPFGRLIVRTNDPDYIEPKWLMTCLKKIKELSNLPCNWDSYEAKPVSREALAATLLFLGNHLSDDTPAPAIVPMNSGNIQIEWHQNDMDIEIEIRAYGISDYYLSDLKNGDEIEESFFGDMTELRRFLEQLHD